MDISTATPVEIDTELSRLYQQECEAEDRITSAENRVHYAAHDKRISSRYGTTVWEMPLAQAIAKVTAHVEAKGFLYNQSETALEQLSAANLSLDAVHEEAEVLHAEFKRRGGWTRAFLVQNDHGHVHRSMSCGTCYPSTRFAWMIAYSGKPEAEIVEDAGERACTVCYPTAPVSALSRPSKMFGPDEITARQAREERAAAKVARDAAKIAKGLTPDGSELMVEWLEERGGYDRVEGTRQTVWVIRPRPVGEAFKTEGSAVQWVVGALVDERCYGYTISEGKRSGIAQVLAALSTKHGKSVEQVQAEIIDPKVAAKIKRDSR